jgi:hypothetical protein
VRDSLVRSNRHEFCFPHLDTHVRVEVSDEFTTIRATRDTFSPLRKDYFIRNLASEGFIPDHWRWSESADSEVSFGRIRWIVDYSWLAISEETLAISSRLVHRSFAGAIFLILFLLELGVAGLMGDSRIPLGNKKHSAVPTRHAVMWSPSRV